MEEKKGTLADMHTHSENSHDSECKIEEMCLAQIEKGTKIFAVTDHFDTSFYEEYDVFAPIKNAYETVCALNEKYADKCEILAGVEIGEGFWFPEVYRKLSTLVPYDVVIGSVHLVKYKELTYPYSKMDFSLMSKETTEEYLAAYFDDVMTMLDEVDFDILAHLTCPIRYISGKYKTDVDIEKFTDKIEKILRDIIKKGIALEVNTSSFTATPGEFLPPKDVIGKYYDMGGRLITLGSDAHIAQNASAYFDEAALALRRIGFKNIYYYKKRKPYAIEI